MIYKKSEIGSKNFLTKIGRCDWLFAIDFDLIEAYISLASVKYGSDIKDARENAAKIFRIKLLIINFNKENE